MDRAFMQMGDNLKESMRWFKQVEKDLKASKNSLKSGDYDRVCFQDQQAAEKSLNPILYLRGFRKILTHPVSELIREVGKFETGFEEFKRAAKVLDSAYIPTRYPRGIAGDLISSYVSMNRRMQKKAYDMQSRYWKG